MTIIIWSCSHTIHRIDELVKTGIPLVAINMGIHDIWLHNNMVMAHLDSEEIDVFEVTTQTAYDSGYDSESEKDDILENESPLSSFNSSPTDVKTHQKLNLKDKEIDNKHRHTFEELCERYKDIFSIDSTDMGKTPLLEMEI